MTRILYWNIQNFSLKKIFRDDTPGNAAYAQSRLLHIVEQVIAPAAPDMIAIVEVYARVREVVFQGRVLNQGSLSGRGVLMLLGQIRAALGPAWALVPPLTVGAEGFQESVAVYYNTANLTFTGPYVWAAPPGDLALGRPATPANVGAVANYPGPWLNAMPHPGNPLPGLGLNRTWPAPGGVAVNEWQGAAQWEHYAADGARIGFPAALNRSPYYTRMVDNNIPPRTIKVFTVHTSPATAVTGTANVGAIQDLDLAANEVGVVVGDFNVDSFNDNMNGAYGSILDHPANYAMLLDPRDDAPPHAPIPARRPYCLTHLLPNALATPFNNVGVAADPQHNVYPRFGYMGNTSVNTHAATDSGSIDNAFVAYAPGLVPQAHNTTIVNTIVGKPYTAAPAPPGVGLDLTGGLAYGSSLALAPALPVPGGCDPTNAAALAQFSWWPSFQRIISTSDHLAIVFDV